MPLPFGVTFVSILWENDRVIWRGDYNGSEYVVYYHQNRNKKTSARNHHEKINSIMITLYKMTQEHHNYDRKPTDTLYTYSLH